MKWEEYKEKFEEKAKRKKLSDEVIFSYLEYARYLFENNLPVIYNTEHLSNLVGYNTKYISRAINHTRYFYRYYQIPKKNGKYRSISEPLPSLKEIQKWILLEILYKCKVSKFAKAYVRKRTLKANAHFHKNQKAVLSIDIVDFFGSINTQTVYELFIGLGYNEEVSQVLSNICTLNNSLPQGAPTSPFISNLISLNLDNEIGSFCQYNKIRYTRYSDDLTFSGKKSIGGIIPHIEKILNDNNFLINTDKLRIRRDNESQEVTGVVVNKKLQAPKKTRKNFRLAVHYIRLYGLESHLIHINNMRRNYLEHLIGVGNFICFLNPKDLNSKSDLEYLKQLKEPNF